jgi:hypothetical protein
MRSVGTVDEDSAAQVLIAWRGLARADAPKVELDVANPAAATSHFRPRHATLRRADDGERVLSGLRPLPPATEKDGCSPTRRTTRPPTCCRCILEWLDSA